MSSVQLLKKNVINCVYSRFPSDNRACGNITCSGNGVCKEIFGSELLDCVCDPGFEGEFCGTDIDECSSNPCLNGGSCVDSINEYSCVCTVDHIEEHCQTSKNT